MKSGLAIAFLALCLLSFARGFKLLRRPTGHALERRLDDNAALLDSNDNGLVKSAHRKLDYEGPGSGPPSDAAQEEAIDGTRLDDRDPAVPNKQKETYGKPSRRFTA